MKILNNINKLFITITCVSMLLAGTGKSVGTAGAMELQIPTGAKGIALNGSKIPDNQWLQPGDTITLEIEALGSLTNIIAYDG